MPDKRGSSWHHFLQANISAFFLCVGLHLFQRAGGIVYLDSKTVANSIEPSGKQ
jgi:hypothetical protein